MIKKVTDDNFEKEIIKSERPVLVDFWAPWCNPCRAMEPALEELSKEFEGKVDIAKLNVDENPETQQAFDVMSIPNLMIFKEGKVVEHIIGLTAKERLAGYMTAAAK
ncbi:MAG TPA: thioredoxin [Candidatus Saccharimonadia bacterium]|nr:thioredoxin [Candidatus Saccharimonadia bacterium]